MIKEDCRQCFIDMKPGNFAKAGEASHRNICKEIHVLCVFRVPQTAHDAVIQNAANRLRLALRKSLEVTGKGSLQGLTPDQIKLFTSYHIAEEGNPVICHNKDKPDSIMLSELIQSEKDKLPH